MNRGKIITAVIFFILGVVVGIVVTTIPSLISIRTSKVSQLSDNLSQPSPQQNTKFRIDTIQENTKEHKINIEYPQLVIKQNDASASSSINTNIKKFVDDELNDFKLGWKTYNSNTGETTYSSANSPEWFGDVQNTFDLSYEIASLTDSIYSLEIHTSKWYSEGNTPDNQTFTYNYDFKKHKVIKFTDLFINSKNIEKISSITLDKLKIKYKGNEGGFYGDLNDLLLGNNTKFLLNKDGIEILFSQYEIGDRPIGEPKIFMSYKEIKDFISYDYIFLTK